MCLLFVVGVSVVYPCGLVVPQTGSTPLVVFLVCSLIVPVVYGRIAGLPPVFHGAASVGAQRV